MPIPLAGALLAGAAIQGGTSILGGILGSNASDRAAAQAAEAQRQALEFQKAIHEEARGNFAPYIAQGTQALGNLQGIAGQAQPGFGYQQDEFSFDKNKDPGAQYLMAEAAKAINASALAKGGMGGGLAKSLATEIGNEGNTAFQGAYGRWMGRSQMLNEQENQKYNRNLGWQQNQFGQQAHIADLGQNSASALAGYGSQLGRSGGDLIVGAGQSRAAGTMLGNNAMTQGLMGAGGAFGRYLSAGGTEVPNDNFDWSIPSYESAQGSRLGASYGGGY